MPQVLVSGTPQVRPLAMPATTRPCGHPSSEGNFLAGDPQRVGNEWASCKTPTGAFIPKRQ